MTGIRKRDRRTRKAPGRHRIQPSHLDAMIEEAVVDAYTESEQVVGSRDD